jgi:DNA-binding response OmpR family regulator
MKILIVEDEQDMLNSITAYLAREGYVCEIATTFIEADEKLYLNEYDCLILDITLPGGNGLDLLEKLKAKKNHTGAIIISAKNSIDDKIKGLNLGADDYLPKPFHLSELNARVNALLIWWPVRGRGHGEGGTDRGKAIIKKWALEKDLKKGYIFPVLEEGITPEREYTVKNQFIKNINKGIKKIGEKIGLEKKITTYTARHTFSTVLKRSGAPLEFISESLGHADIRTTENYLDSFEDDLKRKYVDVLTQF